MLLVIAAIGLLTLAMAAFAKVTRAQVRASSVAVASARAKALAAAGINLAVLKLIDFHANPSGSQRKFAVAGQAFACRLGADVLIMRAVDEGGKIDLNFASERLLRALLLGLFVDPGKADTVVDAMLDYRDGDNVKRAKGAEDAEYRAAGRVQGPKNAPFAAVEELNQVLGLEPELVARMLPFVTAHSGKDGVDPVAAQHRLIEILRRGDTPLGSSDSGLDEQLQDDSSALPAYFTARSTRNVFSVRSEVLLAGGTRFALEAIVDIGGLRRGNAAGSQLGAPYRLWRWRQVAGPETEAGDIGANAPLAACELPVSA